SEEHTSELQSRQYLVCRLLLEKKKKIPNEHGGRKSNNLTSEIYIRNMFDAWLGYMTLSLVAFVFFFNDTATTEIYTLSLHDALPISASFPEAWASGATSSAARAIRN